MKKSALPIAVLLLLLGALTAEAERTYRLNLSGRQEVPGPGDPDAWGEVEIRVSVGKAQVCYEMEVVGCGQVTTAHIQRAPLGQSGPVVATLDPPVGGTSSGCVTVDKELARAIQRRPRDYYVNVRSTEFPDGAIRGQLGKLPRESDED